MNQQNDRKLISTTKSFVLEGSNLEDAFDDFKVLFNRVKTTNNGYRSGDRVIIAVAMRLDSSPADSTSQDSQV